MSSRPESRRARARGRRRAFSVIEIMIVLAIMVLLAGIVGIALFGQRDKADIQATRVQLESIESALRAFRLDFRRYPNEEEGLAVLWDREQLDPDAEETTWSGYLEEPVPTDVWGSEWGYTTETDELAAGAEEGGVASPTFDLWSYGPDREDGTEDDIHLRADSGEDGEDFGGGDLLPPGDG